jgi:SAM-dependent methyltransferase
MSQCVGTVTAMSSTARSTSSSDDSRGARLDCSIQSYDRDAAGYAARLAKVDVSIYRDWLIEELGAAGRQVIDVGCGGGRDTAAFHQAGFGVLGVDLSKAMLAEARAALPSLRLVLGDARGLPVRSGGAAAVWSMASLVHLDVGGTAAALREFARVTGPGGLIFVAVPWGQASEWRYDHLGGRRWFQYHEFEGFCALVAGAGFELLRAEAAPGIASGRWISVLARTLATGA